jgi:cadmium resistance protein CadD (predicted permease)
MSAIQLLGLAVVVFASTNVDDIFVLLGFFADPLYRARSVAIGQCLGIGALVAISIGASLISLVLAPDKVGLLGALPIMLGLVKLAAVFRIGDGEEIPRNEARGGSIGQITSVAGVTMANGGDNIGVYAPLFATQTAPQIGVTALVFAILTIVWIVIAHGLVNHRALGAPIRRYGHIVVPFVLIGLGVYILAAAGSFRLLRF